MKKQHKLLAIVCRHLLEDKKLEWIEERMEPVDEKDSGLLYHCVNCEEDHYVAEDWKTICVDCIENKTGINYFKIN